MSRAAAEHAAASLRSAIARQGRARVVAATAASQLAFLEQLSRAADISWPKVELFHLDEYIGLSAQHPASFRRMLREHLIDKTGIATAHLLEGDGDPEQVRRRVGSELAKQPVDVAFIGIGENGHLAFNDPPADFVTTDPYLVVELDTASRQQQVDEGWFPKLAAVPRHALSMSIRQILASREILVIVPDARKARAVRAGLEGPITPLCPASILREHPAVTLYLDEPAASLMLGETRARYS